MTKPTGRPRGRPKTKDYLTLMARVPQDLAERVQRYAGRKRQTISDVLRDGLLVLLEEEDPYRPFLSDRRTDADMLSDAKEEAQEFPSDRNGGKAVVQSSFLSDSNTLSPSFTSDIKTDTAAEGIAEPVIAYDTKEGKSSIASYKNRGAVKESDRKRGKPVIVSDAKQDKTDMVSDTIPPFDADKYVLGKLCPRAHAYHSTGQTLLRRSNRHCMACDREKFHERKQAKRSK